MRRLWLGGVLAVMFCSPLAPVAARLTARSVDVRVYSDVCTTPGSGEAAGERIIVMFAKKAMVMFQQLSGNVVSQPKWAEAQVNGANITFVLHDPQNKPASFTGTMSGQEIAGSFSGSSKMFTLPYRRSITDVPECTAKK